MSGRFLFISLSCPALLYVEICKVGFSLSKTVVSVVWFSTVGMFSTYATRITIVTVFGKNTTVRTTVDSV